MAAPIFLLISVASHGMGFWWLYHQAKTSTTNQVPTALHSEISFTLNSAPPAGTPAKQLVEEKIDLAPEPQPIEQPKPVDTPPAQAKQTSQPKPPAQASDPITTAAPSQQSVQAQPTQTTPKTPTEPESFATEPTQQTEENTRQQAKLDAQETTWQQAKLDLQAMINSQAKYPALAERRGIEGSVRLIIHYDDTGMVSKINLLESSGSAILDRAAQATAEQAIKTTRNIALAGQQAEITLVYLLTP